MGSRVCSIKGRSRGGEDVSGGIFTLRYHLRKLLLVMMLVLYVLLITTAASARYLAKSPYDYEVSHGQVVLYGKPAPTLMASSHEANYEKPAFVYEQAKEQHASAKKIAALSEKALSHDQPKLEEKQYNFPQQPKNVHDKKIYAYDVPKYDGKQGYVYENPSFGYDGSYDPTEHAVKLYRYKQAKYEKADDYEKTYDPARYVHDPSYDVYDLTYEQTSYGNEPMEHTVKLDSYKQAKYEKTHDPAKYAEQSKHEKGPYVYDPTYEKPAYGYEGSYDPAEHAVKLYSYKQAKYEKADNYEKSYDPTKYVYDPKDYVKSYSYEQPKYYVKAYGYDYPKYGYAYPQYQKVYGYEHYDVKSSHSLEQKPTEKLVNGQQKYGVKTAYSY